jgi:hypothetical protein
VVLLDSNRGCYQPDRKFVVFSHSLFSNPLEARPNSSNFSAGQVPEG